MWRHPSFISPIDGNNSMQNSTFKPDLAEVKDMSFLKV